LINKATAAVSFVSNSRRVAQSLFLALLAILSLASARAAPAGAPARVTQAVDDNQRTEIRGHVHRSLAESRDLGSADPASRLDRLILVLRPSADQQAALDRFLERVQTRHAAEYHHWLKPAEFASRFGVSTSDRAAVKGWLRAHGLHVDDEPAGGRLIVFSGTVNQVSGAFGVRMHNYEWRGQRHLANANNPTVPTALAGVVGGLASLHDFRHQPQFVRRQAAPQWNTGGANYIAPSDFATIYDLATTYSAGVTGTGRSIAILGRSDVVTGDMAAFQSDFGLPANAPQIIHNGTAPGRVSKDETESDLDLEWSAGVAPGATIKFVTSANTQTSDGIDLSAAYAVSNNVADIISLSYGSCEISTDISAGNPPYYQQLWQQAAAQGISVFVSSGDSGAAGCDASGSTKAVGGAAVNKLCSSPYTTCVGGTEFAADAGTAQSTFWSSGNSALPTSQASALSYIGESAWNQSGTVVANGDLYASGGGASIYFAKPAWQYAAGVPADGWRDVPDVSLTAASNHDAYLILSSDGQTGSTLEAIGGTSASTPALAGIVALVAQSQGQRLGNINPALYNLSNLQAAGGAPVFHRITSGNNSVPGQAGFSASTGNAAYSLVSGLGSIDGAQLIAHWNDVPSSSPAPSFVVLRPAVSTVGLTLSVSSTTAWTVSGAPSWLTVTPASGIGPATLNFTATANTGTTPRSATITVAGHVLTITQAAGSGTTAKVLASSSSLAFGSSVAGTTASTQRVQIGNIGNAALTLGTVTVSGSQAGDFSTAGSCVNGLSMPAGASCYIDVLFTPGATGSRAATLQVTSNDAGSPLAVSLSGTGTSGGSAAAVPLPTWAQGLLAFGLLFVLRRGLAQRRHQRLKLIQRC